jgi:arginase
MPAVSYPEPGGLGLGATLDLLRPLGRSGALIGVSVADLNSDLDPDDECARSLSGLLTAALNQP